MKKFMVTILVKTFIILFVLLLPTIVYAEEYKSKWQKPTAIFKQDFDWIKLTSDEWLKGDIVSM
jgi:hypothetical protein